MHMVYSLCQQIYIQYSIKLLYMYAYDMYYIVVLVCVITTYKFNYRYNNS